MDSAADVALAAGVFLIAGLLLGAWVAWKMAALRFRSELEQAVVRARTEAVAGSRRTIRGQVSEQLAPHLDGFGFDPGDARFVGNPIDFVVFDGLCDGAIREVVLVEVKSGASRLSAGQRSIRDGIESGAVTLAWREVRITGK